MRRAIRIVLVLFFLLSILLALAVTLYWRWANGAADTRARTPVRIVVTAGESERSVGNSLRRAGVIRSARVFTYLGRGASIRPGTYDFTADERPSQILRHLEHGDFATTRVTFPEGFIIKQIAHRLFREKIIGDENRFLDLVTQHGNSLHASFPLPANLEGYLFPDTYRIPVGASDTDIAQRMVNTFDRVVAKPKAAEVAQSGRSLADITNIASMIEREAEVEGDRAKIAGVIYNRLAKHMHLELDATVQYAQGFHKTRMLFRDLTIDSPYNTYKHPGLPPTPICSPGLPSIEAALHPAKSDFLYYVGKPDGSHIFARTFAEHEHNIVIARQMAKAAAAAKAALQSSKPKAIQP